MSNPLPRILGSKRFASAMAASLTLLSPLISLASTNDDGEKIPYDARILNYTRKLELDVGGTALLWVLFIVLTALVVGALFKNPNRSHLD